MATVAQTPERPRARTSRAPRPYVLATLAVAACGLLVLSVSLARREGVPGIQILLLQWISIPYIAAGLIAWARRPASRLGPLMVVGGFATGLLCLQFAENEVLRTVGDLFDILAAAIFLHVTLAFPSGRLRSRAEVALVAATYVASVGPQVAKMMLGAFGPDNLLAVSSHPDAAANVERWQLIAVSAFCLTAVVLLALRRRDAGRPRRGWVARAPGVLRRRPGDAGGALHDGGAPRAGVRPDPARDPPGGRAQPDRRSCWACSTRASRARASATW